MPPAPILFCKDDHDAIVEDDLRGSAGIAVFLDGEVRDGMRERERLVRTGSGLYIFYDVGFFHNVFQCGFRRETGAADQIPVFIIYAGCQIVHFFSYKIPVFIGDQRCAVPEQLILICGECNS